MAESPIRIMRSDDGLFVRYELDTHYVSDEDAQRIRGHIDQLQSENAKLRELVRAMWFYDYAGKFSTKREDMEHVAMIYQRMRELGIEVDDA